MIYSDITTFYPLLNENNYNFDSVKIQIDGQAKLIAQISGAESYMYVKLDENQGLVAIDSSGNNRHGAFQGGYTENQWTTGKINSAIQGLTLTNGYINFDQLIAFERNQPFSLVCWIKSISTSTMAFVAKQLDTGTFNGFAINYVSGKPRCLLRDSSGNILSIEYNTAINDNDWHLVIFTYDGSSLIGGCNIYVDNTQNDNIISSNTLTATITNIADFQISGRDGNNLCLDINTAIDEVAVYNRELTQAEISFLWNNGNGTQTIPGASTSFPTDGPVIYPKSGFSASQLEAYDFDENLNSNTIGHVININGQDKYWNGSAWVDSSSNTEVSTGQEVKDNIDTLALADISFVFPKWYLISTDGSSTPELLEASIGYEIDQDLTEPFLVRITGKATKANGDPSTEIISIRLWKDGTEYGETIQLRDDYIYVTPNALGIWTVDLADNEEAETDSYYIFRFGENLEYKIVPKIAEIAYNDLEDYEI